LIVANNLKEEWMMSKDVLQLFFVTMYVHNVLFCAEQRLMQNYGEAGLYYYNLPEEVQNCIHLWSVCISKRKLSKEEVTEHAPFNIEKNEWAIGKFLVGPFTSQGKKYVFCHNQLYQNDIMSQKWNLIKLKIPERNNITIKCAHPAGNYVVITGWQSWKPVCEIYVFSPQYNALSLLHKIGNSYTPPRRVWAYSSDTVIADNTVISGAAINGSIDLWDIKKQISRQLVNISQTGVFEGIEYIDDNNRLYCCSRVQYVAHLNGLLFDIGKKIVKENGNSFLCNTFQVLHDISTGKKHIFKVASSYDFDQYHVRTCRTFPATIPQEIPWIQKASSGLCNYVACDEDHYTYAAYLLMRAGCTWLQTAEKNLFSGLDLICALNNPKYIRNTAWFNFVCSCQGTKENITCVQNALQACGLMNDQAYTRVYLFKEIFKEIKKSIIKEMKKYYDEPCPLTTENDKKEEEFVKVTYENTAIFPWFSRIAETEQASKEKMMQRRVSRAPVYMMDERNHYIELKKKIEQLYRNNEMISYIKIKDEKNCYLYRILQENVSFVMAMRNARKKRSNNELAKIESDIKASSFKVVKMVI